MQVRERDKTYNVVIVGSPNVNAGYKLVNNALYPQIASDYERMFRMLRSLPCDIFLGAHGNYYGMEAKYGRMKAGGPNPFIDPEGYKITWPNENRRFARNWPSRRVPANRGTVSWAMRGRAETR